MNKKIYKLNDNLKYKGSNNDSFRLYVNKRRVQQALDSREKLFKQSSIRKSIKSLLSFGLLLFVTCLLDWWFYCQNLGDKISSVIKFVANR